MRIVDRIIDRLMNRMLDRAARKRAMRIKAQYYTDKYGWQVGGREQGPRG